MGPLSQELYLQRDVARNVLLPEMWCLNREEIGRIFPELCSCFDLLLMASTDKDAQVVSSIGVSRLGHREKWVETGRLKIKNTSIIYSTSIEKSFG